MSGQGAGETIKVSFTDWVGYTYIGLEIGGAAGGKVGALDIKAEAPFVWAWTVGGVGVGVATFTFLQNMKGDLAGQVVAVCQVAITEGGVFPGVSGGGSPQPQPPAPGGELPDPLSPQNDDVEHHLERSLLQNPGMDDGFLDGLPVGWAFFGEGDVSHGEETGGEKFDVASLRVSGSGAFSGGVFQTVGGLEVGKFYHAFYGTAQKVWGPSGVDGALPIVREVGVDPSGGTDPKAPTVLWGQRSAGGQPDKDAGKYGGWKTLGSGNSPLLTFVATSSTVTYFIRVRGTDEVVASNTWIDSAFLVEDAGQ